MLFNREETDDGRSHCGHTTLATARLKFLFLAARIWSHAGRVGVSYSESYAERPVFDRLMTRLRAVAWPPKAPSSRSSPYRCSAEWCIESYAQPDS